MEIRGHNAKTSAWFIDIRNIRNTLLANTCKHYSKGFEIIIFIPVRVYFNSSECNMHVAHAQKPSFLIDVMTIDIDTKLIKLNEIYVVEQYTFVHILTDRFIVLFHYFSRTHAHI